MKMTGIGVSVMGASRLVVGWQMHSILDRLAGVPLESGDCQSALRRAASWAREVISSLGKMRYRCEPMVRWER